METFSPDTKDLLLQRMQQRLDEGRAIGIHQLGTDYTPEQMIDEARRGTPAGERFLMAEKQLMDEMKRRM